MFLFCLRLFTTAESLGSPSRVTDLSALAGNGVVDLSWTPNTDTPTATTGKYWLEFSSWSPLSFTFLAAIPHPNNTHQVTNFINGNTYFSRVRASSGTHLSHIGDWSDIRSTAPWVSLGVPSWAATTTNTDGIAIDDLKGYNIYKTSFPEELKNSPSETAKYLLSANNDFGKIINHTFPKAVRLEFKNLQIRRVIPPDASDICDYWFNGVGYIRTPLYIEPAPNKTFIHAANNDLYHQVRAIKKTVSPRLSSINPPRVFTPGVPPYEKIQFFVENPFGEKIVGEIMDINGAKVADMRILEGPTATTATLEWQGQDMVGNAMSKGVYIYQIKIGEKIINGTVVVAR